MTNSLLIGRANSNKPTGGQDVEIDKNFKITMPSISGYLVRKNSRAHHYKSNMWIRLLWHFRCQSRRLHPMPGCQGSVSDSTFDHNFLLTQNVIDRSYDSNRASPALSLGNQNWITSSQIATGPASVTVRLVGSKQNMAALLSTSILFILSPFLPTFSSLLPLSLTLLHKIWKGVEESQ